MKDNFYVARKLGGNEKARSAVHLCLATFEICAVDRSALEEALSLGGIDFEDDLQVACAGIAQLDAIVTRDKAGFVPATLPIWSPDEALANLARTDLTP